MQSDGESRASKLWTGWYDSKILGSEGEALIARYDDAAVDCFVNNGFTYRTRRAPDDLGKLIDELVADRVYMIENIDAMKVRLFAMSLLWRAAVSKLEAMAHINLSATCIRALGKRIRDGNPGPLDDYPTWFGVFDGQEELPKITPSQSKGFPFVRFFLDGVTCYISPRRRLPNLGGYENLIIGADPERINIYCYQSVGSWHDNYAKAGMQRLFQREGDIFSGFSKS